MDMTNGESITEQKAVSRQHDLAAHELAERYRLLVESVYDYAIFLLDVDGRIATWNPGAQRFKGYKEHEIVGKHFSIFYPYKDIVAGKPEWELTEARRQGRIEDEGWRVRKDGTEFWANVTITALYDETGELVGYAKLTRDLTERKQKEDELHSANRQLRAQSAELEHLSNMKDEFVSLASHQLRTPATGVKQYLGLILQGYAGELTEQQCEFIQKAYECNNRQIELVNDLLSIAQIDSGRVVLHKAETDLGALVQDVVAGQAEQFISRGQNAAFNEPAEPLYAHVDARNLRMAIENLVDNASKYTPEGGIITVSVAPTEYSAVITITDNGVGIAEEQVAKLFTKFSRIPNPLSERVGGSGLGLYWAYKVTQLHGGTIKVASKLGEGTTFEIVVPV
jgi:PAS domain S-box-containing protein